MGRAKEELSRIDLGDQRLNARSIKLLQQFAAKPTASIPTACGGWAETIAAYRFFAQEEVDWRDILQPHIDCSLMRMHSQPVVLCLQDTTGWISMVAKRKGWGRYRMKRNAECMSIRPMR